MMAMPINGTMILMASHLDIARGLPPIATTRASDESATIAGNYHSTCGFRPIEDCQGARGGI
jgi:hypothetical protein